MHKLATCSGDRDFDTRLSALEEIGMSITRKRMGKILCIGRAPFWVINGVMILDSSGKDNGLIGFLADTLL
jgi:hypothetical protein